jgi:ABC-2 type transport system permease protein
MIWVIARHEFGVMFLAPLAWVILAVTQIILGYMFLTNLDNFFLLQPQLLQLQNTPGVTDIVIAPLMQVAAIILLMVMPLLTMRCIAEEKRNRSLTLLISSPISMTEIVLGKYIGLMLFVLVLVSMLMLMPLSLYFGTTPDGGKLLSIYLGMLLLLGAFSAIGLYLSSLTENQTIAAVCSFGILLMLWIIDWGSEQDSIFQSLLSYLSLVNHHESLLEGVFDSSDIAYYLLLITGFLGLTIRQLDRERLL